MYIAYLPFALVAIHLNHFDLRHFNMYYFFHHYFVHDNKNILYYQDISE